MKTGKGPTIKLNLKWLLIIPLAAIILVAIPSCKGKAKPSENLPPNPPPPLPYNIKNGDTVWYRVDELPLFPGGDDAMFLCIEKTFTYPESAVKKKIQGRVVVGFVLTTDCRITDARIVTGIDPDCDNEALRVVNSLPKFEKPAFVDDRPVAYHFTIPVHYVLK